MDVASVEGVHVRGGPACWELDEAVAQDAGRRARRDGMLPGEESGSRGAGRRRPEAERGEGKRGSGRKRINCGVGVPGDRW